MRRSARGRRPRGHAVRHRRRLWPSINEELVGEALEPVRHHVDNLAAAELELTASEMREIDEASSMIDIKGAPLSEALESQIDR
jgi:hypothetical protein